MERVGFYDERFGRVSVLTWEAFGGHVPPGGSKMYWFDQSYPIHLFHIHAAGTLESAPLDADRNGPLASSSLSRGSCRARRV